MPKSGQTGANRTIRNPIMERLKVWQREKIKDHLRLLEDFFELSPKWGGVLMSFSEISLDTAEVRELLEFCYAQYFERNSYGEGNGYDELLTSLWEKILDRHNSLLGETAAGLDDLIVHFAGKEKGSSRLSVIVRRYLSRGKVKREALEALWKAADEILPEDAWLWQQLEETIDEPQASGRILLEGFQSRFGRDQWVTFTPEKIQQWQKILSTFISRHPSAVFFLRETWIRNVLAGDEPEKVRAGWWGVSLIGAGTSENEQKLWEVFGPRLKKLIPDRKESQDKWQNHELDKERKKSESANFMELQAMAHWKPDTPEIHEKVCALWRDMKPAGQKGRLMQKILMQKIWWKARFRLEPEETMLKEIRMELEPGGENMSLTMMESIRIWVPEDHKVRSELLDLWERVWETIPWWEKDAEFKLGIIAEVFSRLGISGSRLFSILKSLDKKSAGCVWPDNLATCLKMCAGTDDLEAGDILRMANTIAGEGDRKEEHRRTTLEMLRLAGKLPQPPVSRMIRATLAEVAGKTCAAWEAIRWEILAPRFNWQEKSPDESSGVNHNREAMTGAMMADSVGKCRPDLPEWLTNNTQTRPGEKVNELQQIVGMLKDENYAYGKHLINDGKLHEELRSWLQPEGPEPLTGLFLTKVFIPVAVTGIALARQGDNLDWQAWWEGIFEQERKMKQLPRSLKNMFDCLKNELVLAEVQKILKFLPETEQVDNMTVICLLRNLILRFPGPGKHADPPWNDLWASLTTALFHPESQEPDALMREQNLSRTVQEPFFISPPGRQMETNPPVGKTSCQQSPPPQPLRGGERVCPRKD